MGLTAIVLTDKDQISIKKTLTSVSFADEIIIIPDKNKTITDFAAQRNLGLSKAKNDWVLFIDDDEIVTPQLAQEIISTMSSSRMRRSIYFGYYLKRLDRYHGQILHHGETGNVKIIRLGKKNAGQFVRPVHEHWQIKGPIGILKNPLIHERGEMVGPFISRMIHYCPLDAKALEAEGKPFSFFRLLANPVAKFIVNYKLKLGFIDGYAGLFQAYLMSVQSLTVRVFQWQTS